MKERNVLPLLLIVVLIATIFTGCGGSETGADNVPKDAEEKSYQFVLVTMDSIDEHWLSVQSGAQDKADELGNVKVTFRAPADKADPNEQVRMVEDAINQKADAILVAPTDQAALTPVVEKATDAGIPVIIIDSPVATEKYTSFVATDNQAAAELAADKLAELIDGKGKIAIISAQPGSGTTMIRENGFKDRVKEKYPDIEIVTTQYSMGDKTKALNYTLDILTANPDLAGFYATNEGSTVGVARGIEEKDVVGKVKVVGFDKSQDIINALNEGLIQATMVQNPYTMGSLGVELAISAIKGEEVDKKIDTGVKVVTKDNLDDLGK